MIRDLCRDFLYAVRALRRAPLISAVALVTLAVGIGAAIANAVFHATGVRLRELPIRPEHLLRPPA